MTHQPPIPSLKYSLDKTQPIFPPLDDPIDYVNEVTVYLSPDDRTLTMWARGQWKTLSGARSRSTRGIKVYPDDKDNPMWLKAIITDAKRRLNAL